MEGHASAMASVPRCGTTHLSPGRSPGYAPFMPESLQGRHPWHGTPFRAERSFDSGARNHPNRRKCGGCRGPRQHSAPALM